MSRDKEVGIMKVITVDLPGIDEKKRSFKDETKGGSIKIMYKLGDHEARK